MSKIEDYKRMRATADCVEENLLKAQGRDRPENDKHVLRADYVRLEGDWRDAIVKIRATYGYYGRSSGYRAMTEDVAKYMVRAINELMPHIAEKAVRYAKEDAEKARKAAEDEAKAVLLDVKEEVV